MQRGIKKTKGEWGNRSKEREREQGTKQSQYYDQELNMTVILQKKA